MTVRHKDILKLIDNQSRILTVIKIEVIKINILKPKNGVRKTQLIPNVI